MFFSAKEFLDFVTRTGGGQRIRAELYTKQHPPTAWTFENRREYEAILSNRDVPPLTLKEVASYLRSVKKQIADRADGAPGKWYRPWHVVNSLRNWAPPRGDYGVGIEVEYGFVTAEASRTVAQHVANWKYIALDREGGRFPIETTFPPVVYSKFGSKSQACRYLKYLAANQNLVHPHASTASVGTHVNVSVGPGRNGAHAQVSNINSYIDTLTDTQKRKYFGRIPYGYGNFRSNYIEWKLFNSQTDWRVLRRYVDIAVALTEMCYNPPQSEAEFISKLEAAYNKRSTKSANVSRNQNNLSLAA